MKLEKFIELFKVIKSQHDIRDNFLDELPASVRDAFFDNEHVESLYVENNALMGALFEKSLLDSVNYFLYESPPWVIFLGDKRYEISSFDDMMYYFKEVYDWD